MPEIFLLQDIDFAILLITDLKTITGKVKAKKKPAYSDYQCIEIDQHPTHLNLKEAVDFVSDIKPNKAYFTHISHKLGFHALVEKELPENIFGYDGLQIED